MAEQKAPREKESFPPKWMLVVAILAILVGTVWTGVRIGAAESQLGHSPAILKFDNGYACVLQAEEAQSATYHCEIAPPGTTPSNPLR